MRLSRLMKKNERILRQILKKIYELSPRLVPLPEKRIEEIIGGSYISALEALAIYEASNFKETLDALKEEPTL